jgi:hypothetical protein
MEDATRFVIREWWIFTPLTRVEAYKEGLIYKIIGASI